MITFFFKIQNEYYTGSKESGCLRWLNGKINTHQICLKIWKKNGLKIITWLETIQKYLHVALKFKHFHISLYGAPPLKKYTVNVTLNGYHYQAFI